MKNTKQIKISHLPRLLHRKKDLMLQMQSAEISSKLKAQSSKSYRNQPLSAFSFRLSALMQRRRWGIFSEIITE
jgi:hypothetical protein